MSTRKKPDGVLVDFQNGITDEPVAAPGTLKPDPKHLEPLVAILPK